MDFHIPIVIDFETYYDKDFTLSKITTERYIRSNEFECIGLSIKIGNLPTNFYRLETGLGFLKVIIEQTYPNSPLISHNNNFDMGILALRYGIKPKFMIDTAIMAKLCGLDRVAGGASLSKLSKLGVEQGFVTTVKGDEVYNMLGVHAGDMSESQWQAYGEYCKLDSDICYELYKYMLPLVPVSELEMANITTRMWTEPKIELDTPLLENYATQLDDEREQLLSGVAKQVGLSSSSELLTALRSSAKFTNILITLGVEVPKKWSEKQNKYIPAVSKTDVEFLNLLEHSNPTVVALVEAKLGAMSSMEQTRTATFLDIASRGLMPVPLKYFAAHTGRYGGCVVGNTKVIVKRHGSVWKVPVTHVLRSDLVWDGENFVTHGGVIQQGHKEVVSHDGLTATPCHPCFNGSEYKPLQWFIDTATPLYSVDKPDGDIITPTHAKLTIESLNS